MRNEITTLNLRSVLNSNKTSYRVYQKGNGICGTISLSAFDFQFEFEPFNNKFLSAPELIELQDMLDDLNSLELFRIYKYKQIKKQHYEAARKKSQIRNAGHRFYHR